VLKLFVGCCCLGFASTQKKKPKSFLHYALALNIDAFLMEAGYRMV
jgi:hypothetical protein